MFDALMGRARNLLRARENEAVLAAQFLQFKLSSKLRQRPSTYEQPENNHRPHIDRKKKLVKISKVSKMSTVEFYAFGKY